GRRAIAEPEAIHDDPLDDVAVAVDQPLVDVAERSELRPLSDRMRILVTGGAGYIGSETVRLLVQRGHEPIVLDTLERGHRAAVDAAPLIVGSIEDGPLVEVAIREHGIEAVIHFAALKSVEESFADPSRYLTVNVGGSFELFRAMARTGVDRLVYSSSCAVYGTPSDLPVRETSALQPENAYGETKLLVERGLRWLRDGGLRAVNLRYFNAAGAALDGRHGEDWTDAPNLVPVVIKATLGYGPPVRILGSDYPTPDGSAIRDYVHVADLADAHVRAVEAVGDGLADAALNLGTGVGSSVREVIAAVARVAGREVPTIEAARRPGDPAAIWADASQAERALGWRAEHDLGTIVDSAWRWHASHPDGYGPTDADEPAAAPVSAEPR
ncbi:MAG TPA: UDP-glucose 4-epimerase GalE, partial [Patescibacteria group bacterium]|nr:UDP-glucose 4-epimerase GalE [Patescibacteria group bacterium]